MGEGRVNDKEAAGAIKQVIGVSTEDILFKLVKRRYIQNIAGWQR